MELNVELLIELERKQKQREVAAREMLCLDIAASDVPLPEELAAAIERVFITELGDVMRHHRGYPLAERRDSYRTSLSILQHCFDDLQAAIDSFQAFALSDGWAAPNHRDRAEEFEKIIQKELFATANAALSLVEHARRVTKRHALPDYAAKRAEIFGNDGLHEFVTGLRILLHHLHMVEAGWTIIGASKTKSASATFMLDRAELERLIEEHRDGFKAQYKPMKSYVEAQPKKIDIRKVFAAYRARTEQFHAWMTAELDAPSLVALRDYDALYVRKKKADKRMSWNALLGNWLRNWEVPPNPHNHLHRFLTPGELSEVNALPRNSQVQADRVIAFLDPEGAADDRLREQVYELFRRAPQA
ncbi:hypothetical protein [uncultured Bradyrhizobium sp.]|jgi:Zn-finger nucleic acid-binding protein|uniref:hypothetical protein n=1 Tax=uncultured Bradyrhizobium sp. TaxID=199684 RepID=UPI0026384084|nr:hypothetical protein [uncultured Bradyrhizobium sp.]